MVQWAHPPFSFCQPAKQSVDLSESMPPAVRLPDCQHGTVRIMCAQALRDNIGQDIFYKGRLRKRASFCGNIDYNDTYHLPVHNIFLIITYIRRWAGYADSQGLASGKRWDSSYRKTIWCLGRDRWRYILGNALKWVLTQERKINLVTFCYDWIT